MSRKLVFALAFFAGVIVGGSLAYPAASLCNDVYEWVQERVAEEPGWEYGDISG
jgi:hypothetical protein